MQIEGTVAVVTGAASGLGEATARRLHANGAEIVIADMNDERGEAVAAELGDRAEYVRCDVTAPEMVSAAIERATTRGRFGISVHCAGGGIAARTLARDGAPHDLDAFRQVIELNLVGTFNVLRLTSSAMSANEPDEGGERGRVRPDRVDRRLRGPDRTDRVRVGQGRRDRHDDHRRAISRRPGFGCARSHRARSGLRR